MNTAVIERTKQTTDARQSKPRRHLPSLLLKIAAMQVVAILFVEAVLFCAGLGEEEIFKLDPLLGSAHLTNKRVTWRSEGYSVSWFNEAGMREPGLTVAKPPGTLRIALLGDSLTESLQVPLEKTFGRIMEEKLTDQLNKPIQVLNFGVSGYSTAQEYLQLKQKVLQYKPDVVLVCYNSRDSFENWSAPDQVITNVRPNALHLPGGKLTIDSSPVTNWMKTPRARFLQQFEWLRQNSRLWGLFAAVELDWSMHNDTYKYVSLLLTRPGKGVKEIWKKLQQEAGKLLPPQVAVTEAGSPQVTTAAGTEVKTSVSPAQNESPPTDSVEKKDDFSSTVSAKKERWTQRERRAARSRSQWSALRADQAREPSRRERLQSERCAKETETREPRSAADARAQDTPVDVKVLHSGTDSGKESIAQTKTSNTTERKNERPGYLQLVMRSLGSLLEEMQKETIAATGGKFAVIALPVRSALCPADTTSNEFKYKDEVTMLQEICADKKISLLDLEQPAEQFEIDKRKNMFYAVHLTAPGHQYVGEKLSEFVKPYLEGARTDVQPEL
jgi:hypothetical protein